MLGFDSLKKANRDAGQGDDLINITPDDSNDLIATCSLFVGSGGDVKIDGASSGTVVLTNIPDGAFLPIQVKKVYATGTTAGNIVGVY